MRWNTPWCTVFREEPINSSLTFSLSPLGSSQNYPPSLDDTHTHTHTHTLRARAREPSITHHRSSTNYWMHFARMCVDVQAGLFLRALVRMCWRQVKCIDYFNLPICESVILVALHSTGESLMGRLRPLPVQLTFYWNLAGEREESGHGHAEIPHIFPQLQIHQSIKTGMSLPLALIQRFSLRFSPDMHRWNPIVHVVVLVLPVFLFSLQGTSFSLEILSGKSVFFNVHSREHCYIYI